MRFARKLLRDEQDTRIELLFGVRRRLRVIHRGLSPAVVTGACEALIGDGWRIEKHLAGHDLISSVVHHLIVRKKVAGLMLPLANDRWRAEIRVEAIGFHYFTVESDITFSLAPRSEERVEAGYETDLECMHRAGDDPRRCHASRCARPRT